MKHIDDIFREGEHQKNLELRPELWQRLERRLDQPSEPVKRKWRPWMVAASTILLVSLSALLLLNIDSYEVEDISAGLVPYFTSDEIAHLEDVYTIPQQIFVNPDMLALYTLKG